MNQKSIRKAFISLVILVSCLIVILISCGKNNFTSCDFDTEFGYNKNGLTLIGLTGRVDFTRLSCGIFRYSGEIKVTFIDPVGYILCNRNYSTPEIHSVDDTISTFRGICKPRYASIEGSGVIDLTFAMTIFEIRKRNELHL